MIFEKTYYLNFHALDNFVHLKTFFEISNKNKLFKNFELKLPFST